MMMNMIVWFVFHLRDTMLCLVLVHFDLHPIGKGKDKGKGKGKGKEEVIQSKLPSQQ